MDGWRPVVPPWAYDAAVALGMDVSGVERYNPEPPPVVVVPNLMPVDHGCGWRPWLVP
jgi:hypothetical protein